MMGWSGERAGPQRRATCSDVRMRRPFSRNLLHGPSTLIDTDHLSREPLVPIGHQHLRLLWVEVPHAFAQNLILRPRTLHARHGRCRVGRGRRG